MGLYTLDEVDPSVSNPPPAGGAPAPSGPPPTPFPTPTPRADGAVIHVVQSGDTMWTIAIRYAEVMGMTPEEALPAIRDLNNNPAFINVGQELVIVPPGETSPAEEPTAEPSAADAEATVDAPTAVPTPELIAETADQPDTGNAICVAAFDDADGDGQRGAAEALAANAAISLFRGGSNVATYVTDGINEPYCFQNLAADSYQVQIFPPADYTMTTTGSWAVAVSNNMSISVEFGTQYNPDTGAVAVADSEAAATAVPTTADTAPTPESSGSNVGLIVLGVAVALVVLAGVGVVLLRKS